jgi:hypothetical protein
MHVKFWLEKRKGERRFGTSRLRWDDNVRIDLREIGRIDVDWVLLPRNWNEWLVP